MRTFLLASLFTAAAACQGGSATTDNHALWGSLTATVTSVGTQMSAAAATAADEAVIEPSAGPEATSLVDSDPWATPTAEVSDHVDTVAVARALANELPGA